MMSFGWSAVDIASAISVIYNLVQALDSVDGAASDYREAVAFLRDLKRALEPLYRFTVWNAYPLYGKEIGEQVDCIREPIETFLADVLKFEPSLGTKVRGGRHRHITRKLQWHVFMSRKVLRLKNKIRSHMDLVLKAQQELPGALRAIIQDTLKPELIVVLKGSLQSLSSTVLDDLQEAQNTTRGALGVELSKHHEEISSSIKEIKRQINDSTIIQQRIETSLRENDSRIKDRTNLGQISEPLTLRNIYYFVLLYLGCFLKNLFLALSHLVQPERLLTPKLLAKYNISFWDAIGRPPRILPYEFFRSFEVFQAFIQHEFKDLPGSTLVNSGRYLILSLGNNRALDKRNWTNSVVPGMTIVMSMIVLRRPKFTLNPGEECCPERCCPGTWTRSANNWLCAICPVCKKEVFNPLLQGNSAVDFGEWSFSKKSDSSSHFDSILVDSALLAPLPTSSSFNVVSKSDEDDISTFKGILTQSMVSRNLSASQCEDIDNESKRDFRIFTTRVELRDQDGRVYDGKATFGIQCAWSFISLEYCQRLQLRLEPILPSNTRTYISATDLSRPIMPKHCVHMDHLTILQSTRTSKRGVTFIVREDMKDILILKGVDMILGTLFSF
ncbi:hypothetical protein F5884DRAFT_893281 [Xylogone sp. PMI_703]|nr:hypothetical protein F5884DRAFT_893281 [Xylogone sp. PMI_703]